MVKLYNNIITKFFLVQMENSNPWGYPKTMGFYAKMIKFWIIWGNPQPLGHLQIMTSGAGRGPEPRTKWFLLMQGIPPANANVLARQCEHLS